MDDSKFDVIIKIVLLGESSVGKTNLLLRYSDDKFTPGQKATIGIDFISKDVMLNNYLVKA